MAQAVQTASAQAALVPPSFNASSREPSASEASTATVMAVPSAMAKVAGSVAHEIRNPLNALFLNADLLEEELGEAGEIPAATVETLRVMREEIERLNEIIKNYLSLSKLGHANFERLELNEVVKEFAEEAEEMAGRRKVTLDLRLGRGETTVRGDRNMLRRVLVNLVQNALDVSPPGGRILLATRRLLHRVRLSVRDRGPGLAAEALPHLFQPFFSTKERGTGLGRARLLELHHLTTGAVAGGAVRLEAAAIADHVALAGRFLLGHRSSVLGRIGGLGLEHLLVVDGLGVVGDVGQVGEVLLHLGAGQTALLHVALADADIHVIGHDVRQ